MKSSPAILFVRYHTCRKYAMVQISASASFFSRSVTAIQGMGQTNFFSIINNERLLKQSASKSWWNTAFLSTLNWKHVQLANMKNGTKRIFLIMLSLSHRGKNEEQMGGRRWGGWGGADSVNFHKCLVSAISHSQVISLSCLHTTRAAPHTHSLLCLTRDGLDVTLAFPTLRLLLNFNIHYIMPLVCYIEKYGRTNMLELLRCQVYFLEVICQNS